MIFQNPQKFCFARRLLAKWNICCSVVHPECRSGQRVEPLVYHECSFKNSAKQTKLYYTRARAGSLPFLPTWRSACTRSPSLHIDAWLRLLLTSCKVNGYDESQIVHTEVHVYDVGTR